MASGLQGEAPSGAGPGETRRRVTLRLFHRFAGRDEAGRREALLALRARDAALADEVASLLGHFDRAEAVGFLAGPPPTEADDPSHPLPSGQPPTEPAEDCDDLPPGTRVGRHVLEEVIGRGGMGVVYRGRRVDDYGQVVAVKLIGRRMSRSAARRFHLERELLALMEHPNIVRLLDGGEAEGGVPYLVMDYIAGDAFIERAKAVRPSPRACAELMAPILDAVAYAHESGVVHRDLKPSNILLTESGVPKVTDFGLARPLVQDGSGTLTVDGPFSGTPGYMAPEQILGEPGRRQPTVDVYALGAVFHFVLTGRPPHEGATSFETCRLTLEAEAVPIRRRRPSVPRDLETIVAVATARDPSRRYPTGREMADDLRRFLAGRPISARRASAAERAGRWLLERRRTASLVAVVALATLIGAFVGLSRWNRDLARKNDSLVKLAAAYGLTMERIARDSLGDPRADADYVRFLRAIEQVIRAGGDEAESVDLRYSEALARFQLGRSLQFQRRGPAAAECYERSNAALRDLATLHPGRHDIRYDLFRGLFCLAAVNFERPAEAVALHRESLAVIEALSRDVPANLDYVDAVAAGRYNLGRAMAFSGIPGGEDVLRRACELSEGLSRRPGAKPMYIRPAALAWGDLAVILHRSGRGGESEARKAVEAYVALVRDVPDDPMYRDDYAARLRILAQIVTDRGEFAEAEALTDRALTLEDEAIARRPTLAEFTERRAIGLLLRAQIRLARGRRDEALADFAAADSGLSAYLGDRSDGVAEQTRLFFAARCPPLDAPAADRLAATVPPDERLAAMNSKPPAWIDARIALARARSAQGRHGEALALATADLPPDGDESAALQALAATAEAKLGLRDAAASRMASWGRLCVHARDECLLVARLRREAAEALAAADPPNALSGPSAAPGAQDTGPPAP